LDRIEPPDVWQDAERRRPGTKRLPGRPRRWVATLVALAVAATGIAFLVRAFTAGSEKPGSAASSAATPGRDQGRVTGRVDISTLPNSISIAEGSVWVSGRSEEGDRGDLVRLDPATGEIEARIAMDALPSWVVGGGGIAAASGSIWVMGTNSQGAILQRVDPRANRLADVIPVLPEARDADVWADASGVWALVFEPHDDPHYAVVRVDPLTYRVGEPIEIEATWAHWVFRAGGSVWVLGNAPNARGPIEVDTLYQIDPSGGEVSTIRLPGSSWKPVVWGDTVWLLAGDDGVVRLDASTGAIGGPVDVRAFCCTGPLVGDGAGGIWVSAVQESSDATFSHVSSAGQVDAVGTIPADQVVDWLGVDFAFDPPTGSLWVVHHRDSVSRIVLSRAGGS